MYPYYFPEDPPPKPPNVGSHWRRRGETLSWVVKEAEDDRVILVGPGNCVGNMFLDAPEFHRTFERCL